MIVYHGSPSFFSKFDYDKIRTHGTSEGVGFYFTDKKPIAEVYGENGYLYTVKFKGKKSLSDNKKTISREEIEKLIIELHKKEDYLSNYGEIDFEGYEAVLKRAVDLEYDNDTDSEILGSIYNTLGENPIVLKLIYELFGYDHIISNPKWGNQKIYVAFSNNILEILNVEKL